MSPFASVATTAAPTFVFAALFSTTERVSGPAGNVGALLSPLVVPRPGSDQSLGVSSFSARTRTW